METHQALGHELPAQDGIVAHFRRAFKHMPNIDLRSIDLSNKTILITGANVGLGYQTAKMVTKCAGQKRLILAVRDVQKGEASRMTLLDDLEETSVTDIVVRQLDLLSFASVKQFVASLHGERIDIVVLNAAILRFNWELSTDGYEKTLQTNYLSTAYLALLLLPNLQRSFQETKSAAKLTFVSSDGLYLVKFPEQNAPDGILEAMNDQARYRRGDRYGLTKLLLFMFSRSLAQVLDRSEVTVNSVNPGASVSELFRDSPALVRGYTALVRRNVDVAAAAIVHAAFVAGEESHGGFYSECEKIRPTTIVDSEKGRGTEEHLREETMELLTNFDPHCTNGLFN